MLRPLLLLLLLLRNSINYSNIPAAAAARQLAGQPVRVAGHTSQPSLADVQLEIIIIITIIISVVVVVKIVWLENKAKQSQAIIITTAHKAAHLFLSQSLASKNFFIFQSSNWMSLHRIRIRIWIRLRIRMSWPPSGYSHPAARAQWARLQPWWWWWLAWKLARQSSNDDVCHCDCDQHTRLV